jgi:hypothetical protein
MVVAFLSSSSSAAYAEAPTSAESASPPKVLWLEPSAGIGTPVGWFGGEFVLRATGWLSMHGGLGLGTQGRQLASGARIRVPRTSLATGLAWSIGRFAGLESGFFGFGGNSSEIHYWRRAHTLNLELSADQAHTGRFELRPFGGLGCVVNAADTCVSAAHCGPPMKARLIPFVGVAVASGVL